MKTVTLLFVGSHVHRDTKFRYLSYDSFRSSTTFIRRDGVFGGSSNKLDSRWKQTVFSGSCSQNIVLGHAVPVAIEPGSSTASNLSALVNMTVDNQQYNRILESALEVLERSKDNTIFRLLETLVR